MTTADIVAQIAEKRGLGKAVVLDVVETFMECVKESMTGGENVYLRGFGSFVIKQRAEKVARNISKNTTVVIPAHSIPAFKSAQTFMLLGDGCKITGFAAIVKKRMVPPCSGGVPCGPAAVGKPCRSKRPSF